ncbi:cation-translocating P-type ATPase [Jiangella rhizosphaerae]|uniref:Cation-transporting P-type ATPase n=1 Tax=Jiangella rhizosphaerae TaxID=2293569 RepID=A0A418KL05_9ACTN|nr:cation-transporting P-type ATPase [Jiangella rhizosphaerae]RIQ18234.1 cation-transporting P-type ATPase [Jiangella rhizosphaerae]
MTVAAVAGLSSDEAAARLARDGPNRLPAPARTSAARRLLDQLVHFFAVMLWLAAALAFVAGLPQLGVAIVVVIVLNALFAFVQESRADRAADRLRDLLPLAVTVIRDGRRRQVDATEVVVGDLLALESGDRVPADGTVVVAEGLRVDTSLLTGESEPVAVAVGDPVHAGTFLVEGATTARVTAIGAGTALARIAHLTTESTSPASPLTRELRRVVRTIAAIAVGVGAAFFAVAMLTGEPASDGLVFAIGVTVALVPEALLPTVTLSLAWGAEQMARKKALVRNLDAVETLGSTTFICTDKTGTLTLNQMTVVEAWTPSGGARILTPGYAPDAEVEYESAPAAAGVRRAARAGVLCSTGYVHQVGGEWRAHGDPMEAALDALARRVGVDGDIPAEVLVRFPFDPRRRRMSVVAGDEVIVKGAPDAVLPLCTRGDGGDGAVDALAALTDRGLRVLAVAGRAAGATVPQTAADAERDLELYALLALEDPPHDDVHEAIRACRHAGIKVAMITGDHPATAAAIASEVGLRRKDDPVLVGAELPAEEAVLGALLDRDGVVVARVSPEDKLRIARALRGRGHVVAMTGDGVNDGPALHEADIGIAMGRSGTDVAREASDLVLLDDHFATLVAGVELGRATFLNIRRFLTYHLSDNVAELTPFVVWMLSGGQFPLALGVLQILALDIGTDTWSAVALGAEPPAKSVLDRPPVTGRLLDRTVARRAFGVLGPTITLFSMAAFVLTFVAAGWRPGEPFPGGATQLAASGAAFLAVVLAQTANAFACRSSTRRPGELGWTTNRLLLPAIGLALTVSLLVVYVPALAEVFDHEGPTVVGWAVVLAGVAGLFAADAVDKGVRHVLITRRSRRAPSSRRP